MGMYVNPGNAGFRRVLADVVYLPRRGDPAPAVLVELKWDRSPEAAIAQVRERD